MKILVACEESQAVCRAFRAKGHEAYSCDIQKCSGGHPEWHIMKPVEEVLYNGWDMLIGFPPCDYLSNAGARWLHPKGELNQSRYQKGLKAREFFMMLYNAPIKHICIENPTPSRIYNLPEPSQTIQPYQFGHPYSKRTNLWLKRLPALKKTKILDKFEPYINTKSQRNTKAKSNKKLRSKTFEGVALAMADQWSEPKYEEQLTLF